MEWRGSGDGCAFCTDTLRDCKVASWCGYRKCVCGMIRGEWQVTHQLPCRAACWRCARRTAHQCGTKRHVRCKALAGLHGACSCCTWPSMPHVAARSTGGLPCSSTTTSALATLMMEMLWSSPATACSGAACRSATALLAVRTIQQRSITVSWHSSKLIGSSKV